MSHVRTCGTCVFRLPPGLFGAPLCGHPRSLAAGASGLLLQAAVEAFCGKDRKMYEDAPQETSYDPTDIAPSTAKPAADAPPSEGDYFLIWERDVGAPGTMTQVRTRAEDLVRAYPGRCYGIYKRVASVQIGEAPVIWTEERP